MQDEPTPTELIKAVADFLRRNEITPAIKGHNTFKLRVSINALEVLRHAAIDAGAGGRCCGSRAAEKVARLGWLADRFESQPLSDGLQKVRSICRRRGWPASSGKPRWTDSAVDQPNYASYKRELGTK